MKLSASLKSFAAKFQSCEDWLLKTKLAGIPVYWWIMALAVLSVALLSWSLLADAQAYENQAQPI